MGDQGVVAAAQRQHQGVLRQHQLTQRHLVQIGVADLDLGDVAALLETEQQRRRARRAYEVIEEADAGMILYAGNNASKGVVCNLKLPPTKIAGHHREVGYTSFTQANSE